MPGLVHGAFQLLLEFREDALLLLGQPAITLVTELEERDRGHFSQSSPVSRGPAQHSAEDG